MRAQRASPLLNWEWPHPHVVVQDVAAGVQDVEARLAGGIGVVDAEFEKIIARRCVGRQRQVVPLPDDVVVLPRGRRVCRAVFLRPKFAAAVNQV